MCKLTWRENRPWSTACWLADVLFISYNDLRGSALLDRYRRGPVRRMVPGYRVYYARAGNTVVLLLPGGDKRRQQVDIKQAKEYWHDYQERTKAHGKRPG